MNDNLGKKLKALRKGRGLTQQQLAEKMDISRATISNYEVGRRSPHLSELRRFADFYGVSLDFFGVATTDEVFELLSRGKEFFHNPNVPKEKKEEIYKEFMRLYLELK